MEGLEEALTEQIVEGLLGQHVACVCVCVCVCVRGCVGVFIHICVQVHEQATSTV